MEGSPSSLYREPILVTLPHEDRIRPDVGLFWDDPVILRIALQIAQPHVKKTTLRLRGSVRCPRRATHTALEHNLVVSLAILGVYRHRICVFSGRLSIRRAGSK